MISIDTETYMQDFNSMDVDNDHGISFMELKKWIEGKAKVDDSWNVFLSGGPVLFIAHKNASKSGDSTSSVSAGKVVDISEFKALLVQLYFTAILYRHFENVEKWEETNSEKVGNKRLNFDQFKYAVQAVVESNAHEELSEEQLKADFNEIDINGESSVSFIEICNFCSKFFEDPEVAGANKPMKVPKFFGNNQASQDDVLHDLSSGGPKQYFESQTVAEKNKGMISALMEKLGNADVAADTLRQTAQASSMPMDSLKLGNDDAEKAALDEALRRATEGKIKHKKSPCSAGDHVPHVIFRTRVRDESLGGENPFKWKNVSTNDLFKGKRLVLFALPGAFTPTCSTSHVPGYEKHYESIRALGVDEVYCLSVNDAFVMRQWGISLGLEKEDTDDSNPLNPGNFKKVKFIPDGACEFTRGMGMSCIWDSERGFGERSWRYSAVIHDMKVEKVFIEGGAVLQNSEADPFEVSNAETMLAYLQDHSHKQ